MCVPFLNAANHLTAEENDTERKVLMCRKELRTWICKRACSLSKRYALRILTPVRDGVIALDGATKASLGRATPISPGRTRCALDRACLLRPGDSLVRRSITHEEED